MTLSLDVLIGTLVFLLPGFIAVGVYAYVGRFFSRPDLSKTSFILVALTLTLPLLLVFNSLVSPIGKGSVAQVSLPEQKPDYRKTVSFQVDGILLRKDEITALWFLDEEGDMG
jgi:hypothetical protein